MRNSYLLVFILAVLFLATAYAFPALLYPAPESTLSPRSASWEPVQIIGSGRGYGEGDFYEPVDITFDTEGNMYVLERVNERIQEFDPEGSYIESYGSGGEDLKQFDEPCSLDLLELSGVNWSQKLFFVADTRNHRVEVLSIYVNETDEVINWSAFGEHMVYDPRISRIYFDNPKGIEVNSTGGVYVADTEDDRISILQMNLSDPLASPNAREAVHIYAENSSDGELSFPQDVHIAGNVMYVVDTGNGMIRVMGLNGTQYGSFGSNGTGLGEFYTPTAIDSDSDGNLYIADSLNNRIAVYSARGVYLTEFGTENCSNDLYSEPEASPGQFCNPEGVKVNGDRIYVADTGNHRIQVFEIPEYSDGTCTLTGNEYPCEEVTVSEVITLVSLWTKGYAEAEDAALLIGSWADPVSYPPEIPLP